MADHPHHHAHDGLFTEDVLTIAGFDTVRDASRLMVEEVVSSLLVVEDHKPVGIITEFDVVKLVADGMDADLTKVQQVMSKDPVTLEIDEHPEKAKKVMLEHGFHHMPVVDDQGNLIGIMSLCDLVEAEMKEEVVRTIKVCVRKIKTEGG